MEFVGASVEPQGDIGFQALTLGSTSHLQSCLHAPPTAHSTTWTRPFPTPKSRAFPYSTPSSRLLIWVTCLDLPETDAPGCTGEPGGSPSPLT